MKSFFSFLYWIFEDDILYFMIQVYIDGIQGNKVSKSIAKEVDDVLAN